MEEKLVDIEELAGSKKELSESYEELEKTVEENKAVRGSRPDFRIVQPSIDKDGNQKLVSVGAMWRNVSKSGNVFYTLKIGDLRLLVFPNK